MCPPCLLTSVGKVVSGKTRQRHSRPWTIQSYGRWVPILSRQLVWILGPGWWGYWGLDSFYSAVRTPYFLKRPKCPALTFPFLSHWWYLSKVVTFTVVVSNSWACLGRVILRCSSVRSGRCWALEHEVTESQGHPSWTMSVIHRCFYWLPIMQYVHFQNGSTSLWEAADGWFFLKNK